jgi:Rieske 2Fe-2S family protein
MSDAFRLPGYQQGHSLAQAFYQREDIFQLDMELLQNLWCCAGHASDIPAAGDFMTAELGNDSAIVVRGGDGMVRAMANVCRHRGSRICTVARGHTAVLTCPYHAWTYHLDGRLRHAREMGDGFDPAAHGLKALPVAEIGGLIFVSFGDRPPALERAREALVVMTDHFGWERARIAVRKTYSVRANWKLALENYHECYHCAPAHPEFSQHHVLARPGGRRIGAQDVEAWGARPDGQEVVRVMHSPMAEATQTGSRTGAALAPLMGRATYDGSCIFAELGFLSAFLAYPDYGVIYRFMPKSVLQTDMEVLWLVDAQAEEGRDYDTEALSWLWDVTSQADKQIIERNQQGVLSRAYRPGPFSKMEPGTRQYVERYVSELAALANAPGHGGGEPGSGAKAFDIFF